MKKVFLMILAVLAILSLSAFALAEGEKTIPGTDFPMPDAVISVKCDTSEFEEISPEEASYRGWDFNFRVTLAYADPPTAVQAFEEYRAYIVEHYPDMTDASGSIILLPSSHSGAHNMLRIALKRAETEIMIGDDAMGQCDLSAFIDTMEPVSTTTARSKDEHHLVEAIFALKSANSSDSFDKQLTKIRETYDDATAISEEDILLDGVQAHKFVYTIKIERLSEICDSFTEVIYGLMNENNDFYIITVRAPEDSWKNETGNDYPSITELCNAIETSFTRTKP